MIEAPKSRQHPPRRHNREHPKYLDRYDLDFLIRRALPLRGRGEIAPPPMLELVPRAATEDMLKLTQKGWSATEIGERYGIKKNGVISRYKRLAAKWGIKPYRMEKVLEEAIRRGMI